MAQGCYSEFTSEGHIQRLQKRGTDKSKENGAEVSVSRDPRFTALTGVYVCSAKQIRKVFARYKRWRDLKKFSEIH